MFEPAFLFTAAAVVLILHTVASRFTRDERRRQRQDRLRARRARRRDWDAYAVKPTQRDARG